jgi:hypothetical protein
MKVRQKGFLLKTLFEGIKVSFIVVTIVLFAIWGVIRLVADVVSGPNKPLPPDPSSKSQSNDPKDYRPQNGNATIARPEQVPPLPKVNPPPYVGPAIPPRTDGGFSN